MRKLNFSICLLFWCVSLTLVYGQQNAFPAAATCCCGQFAEIYFPNLDFESGPLPAPGTFFTYSTGSNFGGWTVTQATIDHCDAGVGNLGAGNPNGASFFVDLHGSPGLGGISYNLFGLTPGSEYRIEFWTAQNGSGFSSTGYLKVAGGAWLNVNWIVSVSGAVAWRKEMYEFTAQASSTTMEFSSTGPMVFAGTLVDDIKIFECPGDTEAPIVLNEPDDLDVECDSDIPSAPNLLISDNCDVNPAVNLSTTTNQIDPCSKIIRRNWTIKDACGNSSTVDQIINVVDNTPPDWTVFPNNKIVYCHQDVQKEFNDWIKKNGNANATDRCGKISWRASPDRNPQNHCDSVVVEFIAKDPCGNESSAYAWFYVRDTSLPRFVIPSQNKTLTCVSGVRDSLRLWLDGFAFAKVAGSCDTVLLSHNFNGDSSQNPLTLTVYAKDLCGHTDSSTAVFTFRGASDTFRVREFSCHFTHNSIDTAVFNLNGCDSVVIREKLKLFSDSVFIQYYTCDPAMAGLDTTILTNVSGCDSTVYSYTELKPRPLTNIILRDCSFTFHHFDTVILQGQYCDSTLITEYIPLPVDTIQLQQFSCDSSKTGLEFQLHKNIFGCDSVVLIHTALDSVQTTFISRSICGLAQGFIDTLVFQTSTCDSLIITQYLPLPSDTIQITTHTCDATQAGTFVDVFTNRFGCDSLVIKFVMLLPSDSVHITSTSCVLSQSGIFRDSLKNQFGCDSFVTRIVRFIPSDTTFFSAVTCDPLLAGNDTLVFQTNTCDSLVFRSILLAESDTIFLQLSSCDFMKAGSDTLHLVGASGCDSTVFLNTLFIPSDTSHIQTFTCNPMMAGSDTLLLHNNSGCDSVVYVSTTFRPAPLLWKIDSIHCYHSNDGAFYLLNSSDFTAPFGFYINGVLQAGTEVLQNLSPGNYTIYLTDQNGCVSQLAQFNLEDPPPLITDLDSSQQVKKGSTVILNLTSNKTLQQIIWQPSHPNSCQNCNEYTFNPDQDIWVYSLAIDDRGCSHLDSVFISVLKSVNVFAPNVFSPNGDNINDYFYIQGDEGAVVKHLSVFNRWGELLYQTQEVPVNQPTEGWDGSFQGEKMIPGVYIFYAEINQNGNSLILKGDLNLIR